MAYKVIDKVRTRKISLILDEAYFISVKFDRSVLEPNSSGTLLSFFSPFGKKLEFTWVSEDGKIKVTDNYGFRTFTMDAHTEYKIKIYFTGNQYRILFSGICKNHFKKIFIGKRSFLQRFVKGPSISKPGQKIYYSHEVQ